MKRGAAKDKQTQTVKYGERKKIIQEIRGAKEVGNGGLITWQPQRNFTGFFVAWSYARLGGSMTAVSELCGHLSGTRFTFPGSLIVKASRLLASLLCEVALLFLMLLRLLVSLLLLLLPSLSVKPPLLLFKYCFANPLGSRPRVLKATLLLVRLRARDNNRLRFCCRCCHCRCCCCCHVNKASALELFVPCLRVAPASLLRRE